ncbi:MAG: hypothetical protein DRR00_01535 [Candidatus Parabeggiatoa sp. nov. 3]|nr:MAG: hypothetical protein DRR00_01535 [Gammaproteobacteria bacterium]RKZ68085.1 MAG: hypothetical protein DRQ99_04885 [Gammaproteobacteria bacterium]
MEKGKKLDNKEVLITFEKLESKKLVMVGSKKTLPTLQGMVLSLNVTNKTVRDNYLINNGVHKLEGNNFI